jgi:hypothetical protein
MYLAAGIAVRTIVRNNAASIIQKLYRRSVDTRRLKEQAATAIQAVWRGYDTRIELSFSSDTAAMDFTLSYDTNQMISPNLAATIIQAFWRMQIEHDHFDRQYAISQERASILIQGVWRMNREHNRFMIIRTACTLLQNRWRLRQKEIMVRSCFYVVTTVTSLTSSSRTSGGVFDSTMLDRLCKSDAHSSHSARYCYATSTATRNRIAALHRSATDPLGPAAGTCRTTDPKARTIIHEGQCTC